VYPDLQAVVILEVPSQVLTKLGVVLAGQSVQDVPEARYLPVLHLKQTALTAVAAVQSPQFEYHKQSVIGSKLSPLSHYEQ